MGSNGHSPDSYTCKVCGNTVSVTNQQLKKEQICQYCDLQKGIEKGKKKK